LGFESWRSEAGAAAVLALMAMLLMSALGAGLVLTTSSETLVAARFRHSAEALDAADAALELSLGELFETADWNPLLDGSQRSSFVDGVPTGVRTSAAGTIDLDAVRNLANCDKETTCSGDDMDAVSAARPWGRNNPRWQLFAHAPLETLPGAAVQSPFYVVVLVADDPAETDGDPLHDGVDTSNPGSGVLTLRAEAFGPDHVHRVVEMTVARAAPTPWPPSGTDADPGNRHATGAPVHAPGKALTLSSLVPLTGGVR
jgi:hypothetical protein